MAEISEEYRMARKRVVYEAEKVMKYAEEGWTPLSPFRIPHFIFRDFRTAVQQFLVIEDREVADEKVREIVRDELGKVAAEKAVRKK